jgi:hypothetical protein
VADLVEADPVAVAFVVGPIAAVIFAAVVTFLGLVDPWVERVIVAAEWMP